MKFTGDFQIGDRSTKAFPFAIMALAVLLVLVLGTLPSFAKPAVIATPIAIVPSPIPTPSPVASPIDPARSSGNISAAIPSDLKIPILMYHYIRDHTDAKDKVGANLSVSPAIFAQHLQAIKDAGYQTINFNDLTDPLALPEKPVIITFDDGYEDAYSAALPALQKQGMTGVFYVVSEFLNKWNYMTTDQVKTLDAAGMQIGSHTVSHRDLGKMTSAQQRQQLTESKAFLEQLIGKPVRDFCYPAGKYNETTIALAKEIGYRTATTVKEGRASGARVSAKPFELPRIRVSQGTDILRELGKVQ